MLRLKPNQHLLEQCEVVGLEQRGKLNRDGFECRREWRGRQPFSLPLPPEILADKRLVPGAPAPIFSQCFLRHQGDNTAQQGRLACVLQRGGPIVAKLDQ